MTEATFLQLIQSVSASFAPSMLDVPVADASLDSFDLLELRSTLEAHLHRPIDDETWLAAKTLRELLGALA
jgi:acyl carrier protein